MVIVRFRNKEEHKDILKKVKKMKEYAEMIEDCIAEEDEDYRYNYDDEYDESRRGGSRYNYRRGGGSRGGRM